MNLEFLPPLKKSFHCPWEKSKQCPMTPLHYQQQQPQAPSTFSPLPHPAWIDPAHNPPPYSLLLKGSLLDSVWRFGGYAEKQTSAEKKNVFTAALQNPWMWRKPRLMNTIHQRVQVAGEQWRHCTGLPVGTPIRYKKIVRSRDWHRHTLRGQPMNIPFEHCLLNQ